MLLAIDVGNTNIVFGLFDGEKLVHQFRAESSRGRTSDEYAVVVRQLLAMQGVSSEDVHAAIIASVVPALTEPMLALVRRAFGKEALVVGPGIKSGMAILYENPREVGADRIVNAVAAYERFRGPLIVVDFGTATTFDCVTADARFLGGVIMPGLRTAADQLTQRTAKLPATELRAPARVIGRRTEECIQAGVLFGTAEAVDGIVRRIRAEWPGGGRPTVVATGGLATVVAPLSSAIEETDPDLTLRGLRLAAGHLGLAW
jgi:type III pantothenate kinase